MRATTFAALLVCTLAACPAAADVVAAPPTLLVEGQRSAVTTGRPPNHAFFELRNVGSTPVEVFLFRAVLRDRGTLHPMNIESVDVGSGPTGRTLTVPPGATTRVTVFFTLPASASRGSPWEIELRVTASAGHTSTPARISRAHRDPVPRKLYGRAGRPGS